MGRSFKSREWSRGAFLFGTFAYMFMSTMFLYFTYTSVFGSYIWYIIAGMQIVQMVLEEFSISIFEDVLPCLPLKISLGVLSYLATMGAIDLYYFILGYLVDVGISIIEIAYLNQLQEKMTAFIEEKSKKIERSIEAFRNNEEEVEKKSKVEEEDAEDNKILFNRPSPDISYL